MGNCGSKPQANEISVVKGSAAQTELKSPIEAFDSGKDGFTTDSTTDHGSGGTQPLPSYPPEPSTAQQPPIRALLRWKTSEPNDDRIQRAHDRIDEIQRAACHALDTPLALIGLFDTSKLWYSTVTGTFTPGMGREGTFCQALKDAEPSIGGHVFMIGDASKDPRFADHPSVAHRPWTKAYTGLLLKSRRGHCLGTFAGIDFKPREGCTPQQEEALLELAGQAVTALQQDMLEELGAQTTTGEDVELPAVWIDVSDPDWPVVGGNCEWERLTGVGLAELAGSGGLLMAMAPADGAEMSALNAAVSAAAASGSWSGDSLPTILTPTCPTRASLQLVFALRPAPAPPPLLADPTASESAAQTLNLDNIWVAEVHSRIQERPSAPSPIPPTFPAVFISSSGGSGSGGKRHSSGGVDPASSSGGGSRPPHQPRSSRSSIDHRPSDGTHPITSDSSSHVASGSLGEVQVPARLETLRLGPLMGKGSYGAVYAGYLRDRPVAVKIVDTVDDSTKVRVMWETQFEALVAMQKRHENIVPTLDWCKEDSTGQVWIVQELCDLGTLSAMYQAGAWGAFQEDGGEIDMLAVEQTALDVARGMRYLHDQHMLHGDLSSNNVLLVSNDNYRGFIAKCSDFGLSRVSNVAVQTKTVGTISHMAPEILMEGKMTKAGDIYSFGVMMWELYCGRRAWGGSSMGQVIFAVTVKCEKPELPHGAPAAYAELAIECMAADADKRPTFEQIVTRLEAMVAEEGEMGRQDEGTGI